MDSTSAAHTITILQYLALIHQVAYTEVCKAVGLTPQQFSDWVKKRRPVPKERLLAVADYFRVEPELLIDEHHYLRDLTAEAKVDVQILYIHQKLDGEGGSEQHEAYVDKLKQLQHERSKQALITRFTSLLNREDARIFPLSEFLLTIMEQGHMERIEALLHEWEGRE